MDERINDAITAETYNINTTGVTVMNYANMTLNAQSLTDSALVRVEHNWVAPSYQGGPANIVVSQDRYWTVHGIDLQNISGTMKFDYNGQNNPTGDYDNSILTTWGTETFTEDSIVLLYRPDEASAWEVHPDFYVSMGSPFDKKGYITAQTFMGGQYTFGYKTNSSGIQELSANDKTYSIYPNPANNTMFVDLSNWNEGKYTLDIYEVSGKYIRNHTINGASVNNISVSDLNSGLYLVILSDAKGSRIGSKRLVVK